MGTDNWIRTLLVANRGEIARRVMRSCKELGITTVAVYSDPDADAPFVRDADLAVPLGGSTPAESYLRGDAVVDAALKAGADAIHPGYGFLSENSGFARQCAEAGIKFVGPSPEAIDSMGSKLAAREIMQTSGVPVLPGIDLTGKDEAAILAAAEEIGWPVLVKASFGGGGRGMRIVRDAAQLVEAVQGASREAGSAFGNDTVFLERYVDKPRHVEIQIMGDEHGEIVSLYERECSIQRRHQKIIEEAPSPALDPELRARMGEAAVLAGKAIGYSNAGTVEFLLAPDGEFYFLEVNTRLQVEHPVTEMITGLDLVKMQIAVAQGQPLPPEAHDPGIDGWAIEVRLYAEDPAQDFLPSAGTLHTFELADIDGIRVDSGFESGNEVSVNYDPMLAKVIAHAPTRDEASRRLAACLANSRIHGVVTNRDLLVAILGESEFIDGEIDTHYLERHTPAELTATPEAEARTVECAVAAAMAAQAERRTTAKVLTTISSGFRNSPSHLQTQTLAAGETEIAVGYRLGRDETFEIDGECRDDISLASAEPGRVQLVIGGVRKSFDVTRVDGQVYVDTNGFSTALVEVPRFPVAGDADAAGSLTAPMPGNVIRVEVAAGDKVAENQTLIVIEAMKMEHIIAAPADGVVAEVRVAPGDTVDTGAVMAVLDDGGDD